MTVSLPFRPTRRDLLLAGLAAALARPSLAQTSPEAGEPFSFETLSEAMRAAAAEPWVDPTPDPGGAWWGNLDYDGYRMIRFRDDRMRWADEGAFRLGAFHLGWLYPLPVQVFEVADGRARPMAFTTADFDYFGNLAAKVPADGALPGVAGIRLNAPLNRPDRWDEVAAFVGATYFRALGRGDAYGASARAVAVNTWVTAPEEFPSFTRLYVAREGETATVWAALDGPSVTGACQFVIRPGAVTEIDATVRLWARGEIEELGIAPLTSMFLFAGQNRAAFDDYRPSVHDSDGLGIVRADGTPIWRPLANPGHLASSYFAEPSPRAFGLYQRERDFDDFQDPGARYDLRPSVEVVPKGDWGPGTVRLVEIPSALEANDNIVAFWVPEGGLKPGEGLDAAYTLRWGRLEPDGSEPLAHVAATRAGSGGVSGIEAMENARKFAVDFSGGPLARLPAGSEVVPEVRVSSGHLVSATLDRLPDEGGAGVWRAVLDVAAPAGQSVEIQVFLSGYGERLTETWAFQWVNA